MPCLLSLGLCFQGYGGRFERGKVDWLATQFLRPGIEYQLARRLLGGPVVFFGKILALPQGVVGHLYLVGSGETLTVRIGGLLKSQPVMRS